MAYELEWEYDSLLIYLSDVNIPDYVYTGQNWNDNKYYIGYSIPKSKFPKAVERNLIKRRFKAQVNICSELKKSHPGNFLFIYLDSEVPSSKILSIEIANIAKKLNQST